ncbi:MAG: amino acid permease [Streptosporangiaceae bacterium]
MRRAVGSLVGRDDVGEGLGYALKLKFLGKPLINEQLAEQRLSKPLALGVLSCDGISSAAYGSEEILIELVQSFGYVAAFSILLPMTLVVLFGIALVVLLYREVVSVYTRAGGSYVVARENFGPRVAQVAAVALMIDYVVTVAVQTAAGSAAILSAFPALGRPLGGTTTLLIIAVAAILIMCYGNLRGIKEAGRSFALPTYLFSGSVGLMIIVGLAREIVTGLPQVHLGTGLYCNACKVAPGESLLTIGAVFVLLRAFANGGSSLTGIEAVSNAVSALRPPEGRNARQILVIQGSIVAFLIAGISWFAHVAHAVPYKSGYPTVLAQEAGLIFGPSVIGRVLFYAVQAGTAAILFTGGNTSFSGFPFLASFVAEDSFLPRWLTKRGHRLVFSSGIIVLTIVSLSLILAVGANVNNLIPFYAIGVFTGFTMAGFGMARYHRRHRGPGWRRHIAISLAGAVYTGLVVVIFAIVKFTEGAWLVVIVFPLLVFAFIRLNRQYRMEATVLEGIGSRHRPPEPPTYSRRTVFVFVDDLDLATLAGLRYARSLRPTALRAVHFVIDNVQADKLREDWVRTNPGIPLDFVDCPDRRLANAAATMVSAEAQLPGVGVTAVLPRRSYAPIVSRLLHDRTADKMAAIISRIPHAAATIVPFDVRSRVESLAGRGAAARADAAAATPQPAAAGTAPRPDSAAPAADQPMPDAVRAGTDKAYDRPDPARGVTPIAELRPGRAVAEGRVHAVEIRPVEHNTVLACDIEDATGQLTALFYGRSHIPGLRPGSKVRLRGQVGMKMGRPVMINPAYQLLAAGEPDPGEPPPRPEPRRGRNRRDDQET